MTLIWYKRYDGLWNMECACGASGGGVPLDERKEFEEWHFERANKDRAHGERPIPCGPKMPEEDINGYYPQPRIFA